MKKNENLHKAKTEKNDEFYTLLSDIEKEVEHYKDHFEGKTVYCNCDDCYESNFFKFFMMNFERFGIKRLITTCYKSSNVSGNEINLFNYNQEVAHGYKIDISHFEHKEDKDIWREIEETTKENATLLEGDGDFRSEECLKLLQEADIVVTNPPFSLFREFIDVVVKYDKKFLVIGNMNAITYKEIFPLIKDNKLWLGYNYVKSFMQPNGEIKNFGNILWFTNLNHKKRNEELILYKEYNEKEYPKYDNYNAINVDKVTDIPKDYNGVMGVPITFLDKYNPNQFEIIQLCASHGKLPQGIENEAGYINGKWYYARILIRHNVL